MRNEENNTAIEIRSISKIYRSYPTPRHRLLELLSGGRKQYFRETRALDDVSFSLEKGGRLGIVGENGSGKSTLLKILAGVLTPSHGKVTVNGRVSALLELGAGFNPELTGRENISQFCMLHGMHHDEIEDALPDIIRFSELQDAVEHPVKTYSSGMAVRLGFACSVYVQPDILIVDEALSVGDAYFQNKCLHKIRSMLDTGITFIYVTHAADAIRSLCDRGLWIERGRVKLAGPSSEVGAAYQADVFRRMVVGGIGVEIGKSKNLSKATEPEEKKLTIDHARHSAFKERVAPLRTGSGEARIQDIALVGEDGVDTDSAEFNAKMRVRVFYRVERPIPFGCAMTLGVTDGSGRQVLHFSSVSHGVSIAPAGLHILRVIEFEFPNQLCPGEYGLIAGIGLLAKSATNNCQSLVEHLVDYCVGGARFSVPFPDQDLNYDLWGLVRVPYTVSECVLD